MILPRVMQPVGDWDSRLLERWTVLEEKAAEMSEATGNNDAFERMLAVLRNMASTGQFAGLIELLKRRIAARALTWLWLSDEQFANKVLNPRLLETLLELQQPRLTRMTLQQLAQLYFRRFDQLDDHGSNMRETLERSLLQQFDKIPPPMFEEGTWIDPLVTLRREASWLLGFDGPALLAERVRNSGEELGETFQKLGLQGFDDGRYGDICRANFYLDTLRSLPIGAYDSVLDELLKSSVSKAPFEGTKRIGHVAMEILIDRAGQEPGDVWQDFIINLAGDPRIANSALNYREWWQPLGDERIQKVRGWLSKEDLRLFLQAVEQFGIETQNDELQRMFPSRKLFLEGLFKLKLIRNTRLLLGTRASHSVKRILGKDVKTSFAEMDGSMSDKAVIYLDCGDFHLVEGSHSFKIWVYLAAPGDSLRTYEKNKFSHFDLTRNIPADYKKLYPGLPFDGFVHTRGSWQNSVFTFLANNGIELDIEQLLSPDDYKVALRRFGLPVVSNTKPVVNRVSVVNSVPALSTPSFASRPAEISRPSTVSTLPMSTSASAVQLNLIPTTDSISSEPSGLVSADKKSRTPDFQGSIAQSQVTTTTTTSVRSKLNSTSLTAKSIGDRISGLEPLELQVLRYFYANPGKRAHHATDVLETETMDIHHVLSNSQKTLFCQDTSYGWYLTAAGHQKLNIFDQHQLSDLVSDDKETRTPGSESPVPSPPIVDTPVISKLSSTSVTEKASDRISGLEPMELQVLRYFQNRPGHNARYAANSLGVATKYVSQILHSSLKDLCYQDKVYGWCLTKAARQELNVFDQHQLPNLFSDDKKTQTPGSESPVPPPQIVDAPVISKLSSASVVAEVCDRISGLEPLELQVLRYFHDNPGDRAYYAADILNTETRKVNHILSKPLRSLCRQDKEYGWYLTESARLKLNVFDQHQLPSLVSDDKETRVSHSESLITPPEIVDAPVISKLSSASVVAEVSDRISGLEPLELQVLRYFHDNPGDRAYYAADILNTETRKVNHILSKPLRSLCRQDKEYGWYLTENARLKLNVFDQHQLPSLVSDDKETRVSHSESLITPPEIVDAPVINKLSSTSVAAEVSDRISGLEPLQLQVLRYFQDNPGHKAHYAADTFSTEWRKVNHILTNSLRDLCRKDKKFGWHLTEMADLELDIFDQHQISSLVSDDKEIRELHSESSIPPSQIVDAPAISKLSSTSVAAEESDRISSLEPLQLQVLRYFQDNPGHKAHYAADTLNSEWRKVNQILTNSLRGLCRKDKKYGWYLTESARLKLNVFDQHQLSGLVSEEKETRASASESPITSSENIDTPAINKLSSTSVAAEESDRISNLSTLELQVLRYFQDNSGDRARDAADVLGAERRNVNQILSNSLRGLCRQDEEYGWHLTETARLEINIFDQQG